MDDLHFGVHQDMMYARNVPAVQGAQWTGVVTQIAIDMLESGKVDAVICVQNDEQDRFRPKPVSHADCYTQLMRMPPWFSYITLSWPCIHRPLFRHTTSVGLANLAIQSCILPWSAACQLCRNTVSCSVDALVWLREYAY